MTRSDVRDHSPVRSEAVRERSPDRFADKEKDTRLPVSVLSGFLGAGKTTVLKNILESKDHGLRIAVIVNDMASLNLDAKAVVNIAPKMVAMQNGCICCTLRGDLLEKVAELAQEDTWDYLVIESTGISEPLPVAQTFAMDWENEEHDHDHDHEDDPEKIIPEAKPLMHIARLDTMITVVDANRFLDKLSEIDRVRDQPDAEGDEDEERTIADLMVDQVEFANVILLNKVDLLKDHPAELDAVEALIRKLNPSARIIRTQEGKVDGKLPYTDLLNTHLFNMEEAQVSAGWLAELAKPEHTPESEEYGVSSIVFRSQKPFHPVRLQRILRGFSHVSGFTASATPGTKLQARSWKGDLKDVDSDKAQSAAFKGVIRSKGQIWLANAHAIGFEWHSAGHSFSLTTAPMPYMARLIEDHLGVDHIGAAFADQSESERQNLLKKTAEELFDDAGVEQIEVLQKTPGQWNEKFGDRNQELVLIGVHLDKVRMRAALEEALLTEEEMAAGIESWKSLEDAFFGGQCAEAFWDLEEMSDDEDEEQDEEQEGTSAE